MTSFISSVTVPTRGRRSKLAATTCLRQWIGNSRKGRKPQIGHWPASASVTTSAVMPFLPPVGVLCPPAIQILPLCTNVAPSEWECPNGNAGPYVQPSRSRLAGSHLAVGMQPVVPRIHRKSVQSLASLLKLVVPITSNHTRVSKSLKTDHRCGTSQRIQRFSSKTGQHQAIPRGIPLCSSTIKTRLRNAR